MMALATGCVASVWGNLRSPVRDESSISREVDLFLMFNPEAQVTFSHYSSQAQF
jgi:hypothetical protein